MQQSLNPEFQNGEMAYENNGQEGFPGNQQENCDDFGSFVNYSNNGDRNCFNRRQVIGGQW